jgi:23S rRNA (guanine2445-N2)-methyltransferase / 23S rRNA (guanine2069-N7)-methyltransferase
MNKSMSFFASCPKNIEGLLEQELISFGAQNTKQTVAGVKFSGELALAYRACLWSRLANRILLPIAEIVVSDAQNLYDGIRTIEWLDHLHPTDTLMIDFIGTSLKLTNSHFCALKVKDAIVDQIREKTRKRPNIDKDNPDLCVNVYFQNGKATVSIDLSGKSLHKRGYRTQSGAAPLKENLAAAVLYRSNWLDLAKEGKPLLDPMCGSGTILIEAAMMVQDYAPGLLREYFGFNKWLQHNKIVWKNLLQEAIDRKAQGEKEKITEIRGYDTDPKMVGIARRNIISAGLENTIDVVVKEVLKFTPPTHHGNQHGIIITNPPYGERLGNIDDLNKFYFDLGTVLRERFLHWQAAILAGNPELVKRIGIHSHKQYKFFNGALPCKLLLFEIIEENLYRLRKA